MFGPGSCADFQEPGVLLSGAAFWGRLNAAGLTGKRVGVRLFLELKLHEVGRRARVRESVLSRRRSPLMACPLFLAHL